MKLKNKIVFTFVFILAGTIFLNINSVKALTQEEAGKYIAEFSINFCDNYADQTMYSWANEHRFRAYNDVKTSGTVASGGALNGTPFTDKYAMDCVGWVSFAIHHALGIDSNIVGSSSGFRFSFFVVPIGQNGTDLSIMEKVSGDLKPGDILANSHHVMVYVGNDTIVDSAGSGPPRGAISKRTLAAYGGGYIAAYRIKESVASRINKSSATTIFNGSGGITNSWSDSSSSSSTSSDAKYQNGRIVDVNDKLPLYKHILLTEKYNFNSIKWKKYGHGYDGTDIELQEDKNLGLKYPKDDSNTSLSEFMKFSVPYLQTWMIPLAMNAGVEAQGKDDSTNRNPLFPYMVIKQAMSDILVNRYDVTTCTLVTKYPLYDIVDYIVEYKANYDSQGKLIGLSKVNEYSNVVESGVKGEEEFVSKNLDVEPNYFVKEANTFDKKMVTEVEYTKYSDSDVENRIEDGIGFQGRTEADGQAINETLSVSNNVTTVTTRKKQGKYVNVTRVWKDEVEKVSTNFSSYTIEDVMKYKPNKASTSSSSTNKAGSPGGSSEWDIGGLQTYDYASLPGEEIEFELSFYCGVNNAMEGGAKGTHGNTLVFGNVASNYWSGMSSSGGWHKINNGRDIGTKIYLDGVGLFTVEDRGGSNDFNKTNRIDVFVARREGETDAAYESRTNSYGHQKIKGKVLPAEYASHQHSCPDSNQSLSFASASTSSGTSSITSSTNDKMSSLDNFLFIGDSLTQRLASEGGGIAGAKVMGVGGSHATHWINYLDGKSTELDFTNISLPDSSEVSGVCVELGINSLNIENGKDTSGVVENSVSQMKTLLEKISSKYSGKPIYVQRVFPISDVNGYDKNRTNSFVKEYNSQMEAYCKEKGYNYIDATEGYIDDDGTLLSSMTSDGVHFSDYSIWINNLKDLILNGKSIVSDNDVNSEEFTPEDTNYYKLLQQTDYINLVDIMNSHSDNYLEYMKKADRHLPHVGYTRSFLTFSYAQLKRLFQDYFESGKVPYIYGESLGYTTYTESNEIKAGKTNVENISTTSGSLSAEAGLGSLEKDPNKKNILLIAGHWTMDRGTPIAGKYHEAIQNRDLIKELAGAIEAAGMNAVIANRVIAYQFGDNDNEDSFGVIWGNWDFRGWRIGSKGTPGGYTSVEKYKGGSNLFDGYDYVIEIHHNAANGSAQGTVLMKNPGRPVDPFERELNQIVANYNMKQYNRGEIFYQPKGSPETLGDISFFDGKNTPMAYIEVEFYDNNTAMEYIIPNYPKIAADIALKLREHFGVTTPISSSPGNNGTVDDSSGDGAGVSVTGTCQTDASKMIAYLRKQNSTLSDSYISDLVNNYISEGNAEGIRGDIAFAQSCIETGNWTFTGGTAVTIDQNNFCGMGVTTKGLKGNSFPTVQLGVRAQIQHLKAYCSTDPLISECVDPRFSYVQRGCAPDVKSLGGKWAAAGDYGSKIMRILHQIQAM